MNFVTAERHNDISTTNQTAAEKMGHSFATHLNTYSSYLVGGQENLYNLYHSAIGNTSHTLKSKVEVLSIGDLWFAMKSCHPTSDFTKRYFLSMNLLNLEEVTKIPKCIVFAFLRLAKESQCHIFFQLLQDVLQKKRKK
jgi:hypothetical protein